MESVVRRNFKSVLFFTEQLKKISSSNAASWFLLCTFFFIVAAASHSGVIAKWSLRDANDSFENSRYSFKSMVDGTAHKPFVYRQFVPALANALDTVIPSHLQTRVVQRFNPSENYVRASSANLASYEFRYRIVYFLNFSFLFLSLFVLRSLILQAGGGHTEAVLAPTAFVLAFPYLLTVGGYFYDSVELFFVGAAVLAVLKKKYLILLALSAIATYNKESFFFYLFTLYPFLRLSLNQRKSVALILAALLISGSINLLLKIAFIDNGGGAAEFQLWRNITNYLMPYSYRQLEVTYGMPGPHGAFFITLILGFLILIKGWPCLPKVFRIHFYLCLFINVPLFILFCATGELRNLSFLYVEFVVILAFSIRLYLLDKENYRGKN
jgi:hypothetical protein